MSTTTALQQRVQKLQDVLDAVRNAKWQSYNDFQRALYTSTDPNIRLVAEGSLRFREDRRETFMPRLILDAWEERCSAPARRELEAVICEKAAQIVLRELDRGTAEPSLKMKLDDPRLANDRSSFGLASLLTTYVRLMPNLHRFLIALLVARNTYEKRRGYDKLGKDNRASRLVVVIISMILYFRNRATNAFQLPYGLFMASGGATTRSVGALNHMCLSVGYRTTQRALEAITGTVVNNAKAFVAKGSTLFFVPFDNANLTHRKASERLDNKTEQINATTSVLVALPAKFSHAAYDDALDIGEAQKLAGARRDFQLKDLIPTPAQQSHWRDAMIHGVRTLLLTSPLVSSVKHKRRVLLKKARALKPQIQVLGHEKTVVFPLPALDQEEASVAGLIKVLEGIWTGILGMTEAAVAACIRILAGDWLSIRNIRLAQQEREDEWGKFSSLRWAKGASMPFHFQLNAIYMLCRLHIGHAGDKDPASLSAHNTILRRFKLDSKKPDYNKARQLVNHSMLARVLELARVLAGFDKVTDLKLWKPTWDAFEAVCAQIVDEYATTDAADRAAAAGDDVKQHAILFLRDSLLFHEFGEAVRDADVGRMWAIYHIWTFMFRGAGCTNYANELLEMKAQYEHEMPPKLREVMERTWLVNRWGLKGRSIPTDLFIEHINGFIKNMFAALGSKASIEDVQKRASATVEVLRKIAHGMTAWLGVRDPHRGKKEVDKRVDLLALCSSLKTEKVYETHPRTIPAAKTKAKPAKAKKTKSWHMPAIHKSGVKDAVSLGISKLDLEKTFAVWKARTLTGDYEDDGGGDDLGLDGTLDRGTAFDAPDGTLPFEAADDPDVGNEEWSNPEEMDLGTM